MKLDPKSLAAVCLAGIAMVCVTVLTAHGTLAAKDFLTSLGAVFLWFAHSPLFGPGSSSSSPSSASALPDIDPPPVTKREGVQKP